jgi:CubicO group peptidase (beta-lactamase class C family)
VSSSPPDDLGLVLRRLQAEHRLPGVSAAVVSAGEVVWAEAVGLAAADGTAATPDTQYRIGSVSKTFAAAAVLLLAEEGRLDLDDPLRRHLDVAAHGDATIRELLSHSSGIQREPAGDVWETLDFPTTDVLYERLPEAEQVLPPRRYRHYSNLGYALLGEVVARASGQPYTAFVDERLIGPLGLTRTTWTRAEPAALGYYVDPFANTLRPEPDVERGDLAAVASAWSTAADLCRWASYLAGQDQLHQVQVMDDLDGWALGWGLGVMLLRRGDRVFFGHGGAMPGFLAIMLHRRKDGVGAAALTNASTPSGGVEALGIALVERALALYAPAPELWRPDDEPPPEVAGVLGTWWSEGTPFVFEWREGTLRAFAQGETRERAIAVFEREADDRYRTTRGRERGELLRIVRDSDGSVTKLYWATYPFTRNPETFKTT